MDHVSNVAASATTLQKARLAKGYSLEDLALTTGLTMKEIDAAERGVPFHEQHVERIEHALR
ncbi:MAG: DNA-binding protein [Rhizobiaceae bacterium]|nr:DNA-binding protein [Rhizobiaceae bacterium]